MNIIPFADRIETFVKSYPMIFTLLVLYQGTMGGQGFKVPKTIENVANNPIFNFVSLFTIAFTASQDIEIAILSTILFLSIFYVLEFYEGKKDK